jgi:hypothetical protein
MTGTVSAFVRGVRFPEEMPGSQPVAWLLLSDDSDGHNFRIGVPYDLAHRVAEELENREPGEEALKVRVEITVEPEE